MLAIARAAVDQSGGAQSRDVLVLRRDPAVQRRATSAARGASALPAIGQTAAPPLPQPSLACRPPIPQPHSTRCRGSRAPASRRRSSSSRWRGARWRRAARRNTTAGARSRTPSPSTRCVAKNYPAAEDAARAGRQPVCRGDEGLRRGSAQRRPQPSPRRDDPDGRVHVRCRSRPSAPIRAARRVRTASDETFAVRPRSARVRRRAGPRRSEIGRHGRHGCVQQDHPRTTSRRPARAARWKPTWRLAGKMHVTSASVRNDQDRFTTMWMKMNGKWQQFNFPGMDQMIGGVQQRDRDDAALRPTIWSSPTSA